jgi:hypothetical protein
MKPEPFTVRVKAALPAVTLDGEMLDIEGTGLLAGALTLNGRVLEVPLVVVTETLYEPVAAVEAIATVQVA